MYLQLKKYVAFDKIFSMLNFKGDKMFNFFVDKEKRVGDCYYITDADYNHIANVLRMQKGDSFLVSEDGVSNLCFIEAINSDSVVAKIIKENYQDTNLPIKIVLFQGLPKSDKMEFIIQKCVELGVDSIVPVEMSRCVVKIEEKKKKSKVSRWQAIAESAAKQSKRSLIPEIKDIASYKNALKIAEELDVILVPYENKDGMKATKEALSGIRNGMSVGIFIGPEGGFDEKEIESAVSIGGKTISLGKRILRTESAPLAVCSAILYELGEME